MQCNAVQINTYKVPNLIISPKCKVYRKGRRAGALNDESIYTHTYTLSLSPPPPPHTHTHIHLSQCQEEKATSLEQFWRLMQSWNDRVRSGESSIEQRPDMRICVVQRISDRMKECEGDRCKRAKQSRRNVELQEVRQIWRTIVVYRFKCKEKQFVFNSLFIRKPVKSVKDGIYVIRLRSSPDEPCSIVLNFLKFVNELLRTVSE